ncbi:sensor histidine kinase [Mycobacterium sp. shizuoka-1]|uniref:sensor histidine kinase n=1 Tax=Mycobacterium sp. shizuoka-1 TaxID=2039281 RepID=UPI000C065BAE|nr:histidine kinase [Mycobacterium sp. shizuoka-1]GAY18812.1 two-component sensor histidine kinase [Mycobacterium sp. shizuoka-1]
MLSTALSPNRRRMLMDGVMIGLAGADAVASILGDGRVTIGAVVLAAVAVAALTIRERAPYLALALTLPALVSSTVAIAALIALFTVAQRSQRTYLIVLSALAFFVCWTALWRQPYSGVDTVLNLVYATVFTAAPVWLGLLVKARSDLSEKLAEIERARRHEEELVIEKAVAAERSALAREMHDVVSHQVSLIAVQAGALQVTASDRASVEAARTIRTLSVRTLDELREMVDVLRPAAGHRVELAPQPSIEDLDALVATSQVPTTIEVVRAGDVDPPAAVQRAIYRAAQEGLTNIAKHAPGASARLVLRLDDRQASLTLTNTRPTRDPEGLPSAHHGLLGLEERAELLGGSLRAGPCGDGFELCMTLPIHGAPSK